MLECFANVSKYCIHICHTSYNTDKNTYTHCIMQISTHMQSHTGSHLISIISFFSFYSLKVLKNPIEILVEGLASGQKE